MRLCKPHEEKPKHLQGPKTVNGGAIFPQYVLIRKKYLQYDTDTKLSAKVFVLPVDLYYFSFFRECYLALIFSSCPEVWSSRLMRRIIFGNANIESVSCK